ILGAVAFSAARLLQAARWEDQAEEVVERLGRAADAARCWIAEIVQDPEGRPRILYRALWSMPGVEMALDDPRIRGGLALREAGLERLAEELDAGRPVVTQVRNLLPSEQAFPLEMGSKAFAAVPIFANGEWWGFLGFGETRYEREWSAHEVEALK